MAGFIIMSHTDTAGRNQHTTSIEFDDSLVRHRPSPRHHFNYTAHPVSPTIMRPKSFAGRDGHESDKDASLIIEGSLEVSEISSYAFSIRIMGMYEKECGRLFRSRPMTQKATNGYLE